MSKPFFLALGVLMFSPLCQAEIFKCLKEGRTVYQNFPCPIDSIGSEATQPPPPPSPPTSTAAPRVPADAKPKMTAMPEEKKAPVDDGGPRAGMTSAEVRASTWGEPVTIIGTGDPEGRADIWWYGEGRTIVFNKKGRVASITTPTNP
jgi:hypothetical protein